MWCSRNESDQCLGGYGFDPWPRSVGQGSSIAMSCGVGHRHGSDLALLWLWCRPAAVAPIRSLAWDLPYAVGTALKIQKKRRKERKKLRELKQHNFRVKKVRAVGKKILN